MIDDRLELLSDCFAVSVGGYSIIDNYLHVLVRLDPAVADDWSDEEVAWRWGRLSALRDELRQALRISDEWVQWRIGNLRWVALARERLQSPSWFMRSLKERLARIADRQENVRGAFFGGWGKSAAILDEEALLAVCVYIDLNSIAASLAVTPETSEYPWIKQRVEYVEDQNRVDSATAASQGRVAGWRASAGLEESLWLCYGGRHCGFRRFEL